MKKRGFTLIELLAVLAIISIISTIFIMRFDVVSKVRANMELETLINDVNHTKIKAISTGNKHVMVFKGNSYDIICVGATDEIIGHKDFNHISFKASNIRNKSNMIIYNPNGHISNSGTIKIVTKIDVDEDLIEEISLQPGMGYAKIK